MFREECFSLGMFFPEWAVAQGSRFVVRAFRPFPRRHFPKAPAELFCWFFTYGRSKMAVSLRKLLCGKDNSLCFYVFSLVQNSRIRNLTANLRVSGRLVVQKDDKIRVSGRLGVAKCTICLQIYVCLAYVWKAGGSKVLQIMCVWKARWSKICN